jgi:2,3-dihydroxybiphenyl 1,2-dioxygenase
MQIKALGYIGVHAPSPSDWVEVGTHVLGFQLAHLCDEYATFRMDSRVQRVTVVPGTEGGIAFLGWEVADETSLGALVQQLDAHGISWREENAALAVQRGVRKLISFTDPDGNRLEAFHGASDAPMPFVPGRNISHFVTDPLGMGHIALTTGNIQSMLEFYGTVLEFSVSDWVEQPFRAHFFHINPRHHSLAVLNLGRPGVHHLMVELYQLDDVGQGYDRAQQQPGLVSVTLGRHSNDLMTSFYVNTPSKFLIEYGWGGMNIDPASWTPRELTEGPSLWGHERSWLPPEGRAEALRLRLKAAEAGLRQPVQVLPGNFRDTRLEDSQVGQT